MGAMRLTILGCGSSGGVPRVGYGWGACDPQEARNRRRRCSLLVETDAPFLAPEPHRGRTNEPAYTADTARSLAQTLDMDPADFAALTTANFHRLFHKAAA